MALNVQYDRKSLIIEGKREFILSGSFHYYRLPSPILWKDRIKKMKDAGLNTVDIYFPWNYHSPSEGVYNFEKERDVDYLLNLIEEEKLYLIARPGPYICSEVDAGGFPSYLLNKEGVILRCREGTKFKYSSEFLKYVKEWYEQIVPRIAKKNNLILFQIENEYNFLLYTRGILGFLGNLFRSFNPNIILHIMGTPLFRKLTAIFIEKATKPSKQIPLSNQYFKELYNLARELGIKVPIFHNDITSFGERMLDVDIMAIDDYSITSFDREFRGNEYIFSTIDIMEKGLNSFAKDCPLFVAELQAGWYDTWGGKGYDKIRKVLGWEQIDLATKSILAQGATLINYYMFCGGTTYGYLGSPDVYTSYDFAAPINEAGKPTERYYMIKMLSEFIKEWSSELVETERDESIKSSNKKIFCIGRVSPHKKFVYLRNLGKIKRKTKISIYPQVLELNPMEMKVLVLDKDNRCEAIFGSSKPTFKEEKKDVNLPHLNDWNFITTSYISPDFDDSKWKEIPSYMSGQKICTQTGEKMDIDSLGVHHGFIWYRGRYKGKIKEITLDARHCYTIYLNGKLIASYDNFPNFLAVGPDFARKKRFKLPLNLQTKEENLLCILVESLGHNKDFECDAKNPRGIISLDASGILINWRYKGGLVGEKGLTPFIDFEEYEKNENKIKVFLPHNLKEDLGVGIYYTEFNLKIEEDIPIGLVIDAQSKANIYLNGYLIGRYWDKVGPQKKFYLPKGMLNYQGKNRLLIAVWKREEKGGLGKVHLETY